MGETNSLTGTIVMDLVGPAKKANDRTVGKTWAGHSTSDSEFHSASRHCMVLVLGTVVLAND